MQAAPGHRQIILDTETTGMNREAGERFTSGHRIIEIGCVEMVDRKLTGNHYHVYINPEQEIDPEDISDFQAIAGHGVEAQFNGQRLLFGNQKLMEWQYVLCQSNLHVR